MLFHGITDTNKKDFFLEAISHYFQILLHVKMFNFLWGLSFKTTLEAQQLLMHRKPLLILILLHKRLCRMLLTAMF